MERSPKDEYLRLLRMAHAWAEIESEWIGRYAWVDSFSREKERLSKGPSSAQSPVSHRHLPFRSSSEKRPVDDRANQMKELSAVCAGCTRCKLAQTRRQVVFGGGPISSSLVIIGEAPGFYEDRQGIPFVGEAGALLNKMLQSIGIDRDQVYICNVIKCRPPENRNPEPDEILACRPWLTQQLHLLQPKMICAMGKFASRFLTGIDQSMSFYRGNIYEYRGIRVVCTYHPAYLLRNPAEKKKSWQDLLRLKELLGME